MHTHTHLVLQPMPAALQMHLLCVWVVETTFAEFAVESNHFALVVANLNRKFNT